MAENTLTTGAKRPAIPIEPVQDPDPELTRLIAAWKDADRRDRERFARYNAAEELCLAMEAAGFPDAEERSGLKAAKEEERLVHDEINAICSELIVRQAANFAAIALKAQAAVALFGWRESVRDELASRAAEGEVSADLLAMGVVLDIVELAHMAQEASLGREN